MILISTQKMEKGNVPQVHCVKCFRNATISMLYMHLPCMFNTVVNTIS